MCALILVSRTKEGCVCEASCDSHYPGGLGQTILQLHPFNRLRCQKPKGQTLLWQNLLKSKLILPSPQWLKGNQSSMQLLRKRRVWGHFLKTFACGNSPWKTWHFLESRTLLRRSWFKWRVSPGKQRPRDLLIFSCKRSSQWLQGWLPKVSRRTQRPQNGWKGLMKFSYAKHLIQDCENIYLSVTNWDEFDSDDGGLKPLNYPPDFPAAYDFLRVPLSPLTQIWSRRSESAPMDVDRYPNSMWLLKILPQGLNFLQITGIGWWLHSAVVIILFPVHFFLPLFSLLFSLLLSSSTWWHLHCSAPRGACRC